MALPPIQALCLAGPTASGKSALALAVAKQLPVEIISVDSALVYRGMDIGTAKPSAAEQAAVPHHLIDILEPTQSYSAAEFARDAQRLIPQIRARGRLPLLVGGTMLYFKALLEGLDDLPPADATVRRQIDERARAIGWPALHAELARIDPATAARLAPTDSQRIQRALEVKQITGRPLSSFHTSKTRAAGADRASAMPLFSLEPTDRTWLHQRITQRFDAMRCVGYRQAWQALDQGWPMALLRERGVIATRQLAKRQLTWLRGMDNRQVLGPRADEPTAELAQRLIGLLARLARA